MAKEDFVETTLMLKVTYNTRLTDPEGIASALDTLLETAMSTPGILEEYGRVEVEPFLVSPLPELVKLLEDARQQAFDMEESGAQLRSDAVGQLLHRAKAHYGQD